MNIAAFALFALIPAMTGPMPQDAPADALITRLCGGGTVTIPLPGRDPEPVTPPSSWHVTDPV